MDATRMTDDVGAVSIAMGTVSGRKHAGRRQGNKG